MRHSHSLSLLISALLCLACSHPHPLPTEVFFADDNFSPDSLTDLYPLPVFTLVTAADTTLFESLSTHFKDLSAWDAPIEAIGCSPSSHKPLFATFLTPRYRAYHFLDDETEALYEQVMASLPDYQVRLIASDEGRHNLLVEASDDRTPKMWYNYNCDSLCATLIHAPSQISLRRYLSPVVPVTFETRDNVQLHGYLTLPHGAKADAQPRLHAIIMPHAFGALADRWEYNPEVQFLANRGLAVLQVEYRDASSGSTLSADDARQQAIHDVRDASNWLVRSGIANPRKIFYHVHDDLPYASADRMFRDPAATRTIDHRQRMAFYNDMADKSTH